MDLIGKLKKMSEQIQMSKAMKMHHPVNFKHIGIFEYESLPDVIRAISDDDIAFLNQVKNMGLNLNIPIKSLNKSFFNVAPITAAIILDRKKSIHWLVENGCDLNVKGYPAALSACRYSDGNLIKYLVAHGANIDLVNNVESDAFCEALNGEKIENLETIEELGHTAKKYGGDAFRSTVYRQKYDVLKFFLDHDVDINYCDANMVYPYSPTSLCVATRNGDLEMCRFLVSHGADVTLAEENGSRPYTIAIENRRKDLAAYFKALEPEEFHKKENKLIELKKINVPSCLLELLDQDEPELQCESKYGVKWIRFFSLTDTVLMKYGKQNILRLSKETDNYPGLEIVWLPKNKTVAVYDVEVEDELDNNNTFRVQAKADDFLNDPGKYIDKYLGNE